MDLNDAELHDIFNALVVVNCKTTYISMCRKLGTSYRNAEDMFDFQRKLYLKEHPVRVTQANFSEPE